ncbi:glycosyltransferase family 2 protein [Humisphaera borealis]|uniref:Glycosyltransferase n=1 Tax=Humisphaera borealis TaxID=2807512 RepID=A0A7M2WYT6_9BACT|nr:glycosyltransferase [Humisphaera borealis]QOV90636.1 glycosyltransferase [Humisphaera borealis]
MIHQRAQLSTLQYTVVIASFRRPKLLLQTIDQLMPQVGPEGEVIVVEQAPLRDLRPELSQYDRLIYVVLPRPGTVAARNHAITIARGDILIFVDDDVISPAGFIAAHLAEYRDPTVGGVAGRVVDLARQSVGNLDPRALDAVDGWRWTTYDHFIELDVSHAPTCNLSLRRNAVLQAGSFDPLFQLAWREDSDLCFRVRAMGYRLVYRPAAWLTHLSANEGGTREGRAVGLLARELQMYRKHYLHYRDNLCFLLKHFQGPKRSRWIIDAYRTYVGLSYQPWRLLAKNCAFLIALWDATRLIRFRKHSCADPQAPNASLSADTARNFRGTNAAG